MARATIAAAAGLAERHGWLLEVLALDDTTGQEDLGYLRQGNAFQGFGGKRMALGAATLAGAFRSGHVGTIFCHANLATLGLLFPPRNARHGRGYAVVAHGIDVWNPLPWHRALALRRADEVWPVSGFTARTLEKEQRVIPDRIRVIFNCIDPLWKPTAAIETADRRFVLTVGRMSRGDRYKGIETLLAAFAARQPDLGDLELLVAGDGDDRPRLEDLARRTKAADRIRFAGAVSDVELARLYQSCEFFALPSGKEGFGLVFLEAMAAAKPVIAAYATAVPEVVIDGETGFLVPFGDEGAIASAMVRLARDKALRDRLGRRGRERVRDLFTFQVYEKALGEAVERLWVL
jgi:glycosyltransferase involved in cell wall biosynthesis